MTVFDTSALARPLFTDADFTATKWDSASEKAAFANALCRFMSDDFRESLFTQKLYRRLALSFGHIAHDAARVIMRSNAGGTQKWPRFRLRNAPHILGTRGSEPLCPRVLQ